MEHNLSKNISTLKEHQILPLKVYLQMHHLPKDNIFCPDSV